MRACTFDGTKYIYLPDLLSAEQDIAARLGELATFPTESPKTLESDIRVLELTQGFEYAPLQREAIRLALLFPRKGFDRWSRYRQNHNGQSDSEFV